MKVFDFVNGSVIGPHLFLLFVNDPHEAVDELALLFAVDVIMVTRLTLHRTG